VNILRNLFFLASTFSLPGFKSIMVVPYSCVEDVPSSPDTDQATTTTFSELSTPLTQSGRSSPVGIDITEIPDETVSSTHKKKKKKKSKKTSKAKDATAKATATNDGDTEGRQPVLCISRNKHWRYISSYHVCVFSVTSKSYPNANFSLGTLASTPRRTSRFSLDAQSRSPDTYRA